MAKQWRFAVATAALAGAGVSAGAAAAAATAAAAAASSSRPSIGWSAAPSTGKHGEICPYESLSVAWSAPSVATERGERRHAVSKCIASSKITTTTTTTTAAPTTPTTPTTTSRPVSDIWVGLYEGAPSPSSADGDAESTELPLYRWSLAQLGSNYTAAAAQVGMREGGRPRPASSRGQYIVCKVGGLTSKMNLTRLSAHAQADEAAREARERAALELKLIACDVGGPTCVPGISLLVRWWLRRGATWRTFPSPFSAPCFPFSAPFPPLSLSFAPFLPYHTHYHTHYHTPTSPPRDTTWTNAS